MFETSDSTAKLDEALAKAQGEIESAIKDKINPAFKSKYADLTAIWDAARPALSRYGISVTQWPCHSEDNRLHMVTRLGHAGEWMRCKFSIPVTKQDAHGYGSANTYARRYALAAAVGVVADLDDDGNAASGKGPKKDDDEPAPAVMLSISGTPGASKAAQRANTERMTKEIRDMTTVSGLKAWFQKNAGALEELPPDWVDEIRIEYHDKLNELKARAAA